MVKRSSPSLDRVFHALAHPARRSIIRRLAGGECNLSELASPLKISFPAVSKHVRVLEQARIIRRRVCGRQHFCRLEAKSLQQAAQWTEEIRAIWEARFQALDSLLEQMKAQDKNAQPNHPT